MRPAWRPPLGTLIHSIAADFPQGSLTDLRKALDERFGELGLGEGWVAARERERAEGMVERLAAYIQKRESDGVTEVQVEAPVNQRVGDAVIRGSMDRVERGPSGTRIVDLKTGGTAVSKEKALTHAQLGIYQLAAQEAAAEGEASDGAELVYVGGSTQAPSERFQPPLEEGGGWARELLDDTVAVMRGSAFMAVLNETCRHCPVKTSCPVQREGGRCGA